MSDRHSIGWRGTALATLLAASATSAGAASPGILDVFQRACLDTFPDFAGAPEAFEEAGWSETQGFGEAGEARHFTFGASGLAMVDAEVPTGSGTAASCTVLAEPPEPDPGAARAAIAAHALLAPDPLCFEIAETRSCTWIWAEEGGCRSAVATEVEGRLASLVALSVETDAPCTGLPQ